MKMKINAILLGLMAMLLGLVTTVVAVPGGVTERLTPTGVAPAGCVPTFAGEFVVHFIMKPKAKRSEPAEMIKPRDVCPATGSLVATLSNGILVDSLGRTGYIASNYQFQFDKPPQAGAMYTAGFTYCPDTGLVAFGDSPIWWACESGGFSNIYDRNWAAQCSEMSLAAVPCGPGSGNQAPPTGTVVGTSVVVTTVITVLADGQPQVRTTTIGVPMCQIGDGQVQLRTTPCAALPASTAPGAPVSQISDGQVQVPSASGPAPAPPAPVTTTAPGNGTMPGPTTKPATGAAPPPSSPPAAPAAPPASTGPAPNVPSSGGSSSTGGRASVAALAVGLLGALMWA